MTNKIIIGHKFFVWNRSMGIKFFLTSFILGIGLAMDACAVSMSNGLKESNLKLKKIIFISLMFGLFQGLMPLIGYLIGAQFISVIKNFIPWLALGILGFLGGKMIFNSFKNEQDEDDNKLTLKVIMVQTIATSIDALSVGLTIADYKLIEAIVAVSIVAAVTFCICVIGHYVGKKFGDWLGKKAEFIGGLILVGIGIEIFVSGMFF